MWDRARQLRVSGEYWVVRVRVVYFHILSSKGDSPCLCWLRTDRLAIVNKIDYVLVHTGFMRSHKLCSFNGRWVGWHPTVHTVGLDSLIVVVNYGHLWCLCGSRVSCCQVICLAHTAGLESLWHPRLWVMLVRCYHSVEVPIHHCSYDIYGYVNGSREWR
jgi:hypothetical protein